MVSCKKNYQEKMTEFVRNLPDSCQFLAQVDNEVEHLVYFKSIQDFLYCFDAEKDVTEIIPLPSLNGSYGKPLDFGAGKENIVVGYKDEERINDGPSVYNHVCLLYYDLKTRSFKEEIDLSDYELNSSKKQFQCVTYDTDRYGDGDKIIETYDFDGNVLYKNVKKVEGYVELP